MKSLNLILLFLLITIITFGQKYSGFPQKEYPAKSKFLIETKAGVDINKISEGDKVEFAIINCVYNDKQLAIESGFNFNAQIYKIEKPTLLKKNGKIEILIRSLEFRGKTMIVLNQVNEFPIDKSYQSAIIESEVILNSRILIDIDYNEIIKGYYENSFTSTIDEFISSKKFKFITNSAEWTEKKIYSGSDSLNFLNTNIKHKDFINTSSETVTPLFKLSKEIKKNTYNLERDNAFRTLFNLHYNTSLPRNLGKEMTTERNGSESFKKYVKSEYEYLPKSGLILYNTLGSTFGVGAYNLYLYVFHPIFGPLKISESASGLKLLLNQKTGIDFSVFNSSLDYFYTKEKYPYTYGNSIHIETLDGSSIIDGDWGRLNDYEKRANFYKISDFDLNKQFKLGEYFIEKVNEKEYKYYPSYEEKEVLYNCCNLSRLDLINPNYYYYKKEPGKVIYKYTLLNNYFTPLTYPNYYDEIIEAENNYFITKFNGKYGIICMNQSNIENNSIKIFDNKFDKIVYLKNGIFELNSNTIKEYVDFNGNKLERKK
jgi:hypothetical protein